MIAQCFVCRRLRTSLRDHGRCDALILLAIAWQLKGGTGEQRHLADVLARCSGAGRSDEIDIGGHGSSELELTPGGPRSSDLPTASVAARSWKGGSGFHERSGESVDY
jgi:hypothetical protein